jgi:putative ABC transport system permease protein
VRLNDLLVLPVASLGQQKMRTMLTTLGVIFGAFVLAASLSIGEGVQETIDRESRKNDFSRKVTVSAKWEYLDSKTKPEVKVEGQMSPERRERIRKALEQQNQVANPPRVRVILSRDRLNKLAALPHVTRVIPIVNEGGLALLGSKPEGTGIHSGGQDTEAFRKRIIAGRSFNASDEQAVLVSEMLAYRMGLVNDIDLQQLLGKPLRLEIEGGRVEPGFDVSIRKTSNDQKHNQDEALATQQLAAQLPGALDKLDLTDEEIETLRKAIQPGPPTESSVVSRSYPVIGVFRHPNEEEQKEGRGGNVGYSAVILPDQTGADFYFLEPGRREEGVSQAVLLADSELNVKDVVKQVEGMGLNAHAAIEFIERERLMYLLIFGGMTCVAGVALLVSALGIANTMLMSVLERTREIGIMKAVGADNRHLLWIFLVEGGLIGSVGGLIGYGLAYAASFPGDAWVRSMVMRDLKIELSGSIFVFPPWVAVTVVGFTLVVTTLAAVYPARHAARIDPVKALRHE